MMIIILWLSLAICGVLLSITIKQSKSLANLKTQLFEGAESLGRERALWIADFKKLQKVQPSEEN